MLRQARIVDGALFQPVPPVSMVCVRIVCWVRIDPRFPFPVFPRPGSDGGKVGPGVWNNWKGEVLIDLYQQTMRHLAGDTPRIDTGEQVEQRRSTIRACLSHEPEQDLAWSDEQVDALPRTYLFASPKTWRPN